ncbi:MAG: M17 family peptidase N-terminal domain-containing protein, partial [Solirubrobacteraceae bacterium]
MSEHENASEPPCRSTAPVERVSPTWIPSGGYRPEAVHASWTSEAPHATDADTVAIGVFEDEQPPAGVPTIVAELLASGEALPTPKSVAVAHSDGKRWLIVGLGARTHFTAERARAAGAVARDRARELSTVALCWQTPDSQEQVVEALVQGTILADYSFERFKSSSNGGAGRADARPK